MSFTLRYPVSIVSPQSIGTVAGFEVDSLSLSLEDDAGFHVFSVSGFPTADEAVRFADRLWLALMWAVTRRHTAFRVTGKPSVQELAADPDMVGRNLRLNRPVDVLLDTAVPSVFPTSARAAFITGGSVSVSNQLPFDRFADSLSEGIDVAGSLDLTDRLTTALALYNDHHFETSHAAKQVALMTCLEVLAEGRPKHPVAQEFLDRWEKELKVALEVAGDPEITNSLDALGRELIFRREDSLRSRVRRLAWEAVPELDQDDRVAFSRRVVRLYDLRSQLVHEGAVPLAVLGKANDEARQLVGEILRVQLLKGRTSA